MPRPAATFLAVLVVLSLPAAVLPWWLIGVTRTLCQAAADAAAAGRIGGP